MCGWVNWYALDTPVGSPPAIILMVSGERFPSRQIHTGRAFTILSFSHS